MSPADSAVRRLVPADAQEVHDASGGFGLTPERLAQELTASEDFWWVGLAGPSGRLGAVHRSMRWGPYLFLKGVYVTEELRGSAAALQLAFALRDAARSEGLAGIAAWVEPGMPEAGIAELLRLRPHSPLIYRVALPVGSGDAVEKPSARGVDLPRFRGEVVPPSDTDSGGPAEPCVDLFGNAGDPAAIHWVLDGRRIVASASFGTDRRQLDALLAVLGPIAQANGAGTVEIPVPAGDIIGALQVSQAGGRRSNRMPITLGMARFTAGRRDVG
jgi:hypothetical protein